jgi:isopenicillin-N epimerase
MTDIDRDDAWRSQWSLPQSVTYLNHGSFGPSPVVVQQTRQQWSERLESQPMEFFLRRMEDHLEEASGRLGKFVGAEAADLVFVENATHGMNIVAANLDLKPEDEVLCTDHEYGAVLRIWRRTCKNAGARAIVRQLPVQIESDEELVETFLQGVTDKTRLIVVSHVTSQTAIILPVEKICSRAREKGVPVCIDGPHALAMLPVNLKQLGCDYYTASCHKWLSAPFGTGFLYVARHRHQNLKPAVISWGRSVSGRPLNWKDEFTWIGTHDPSGFLSVPAAIDFLKSCGLDTFRDRTHALARYARQRLTELTGLEPLVPDSRTWYGSMITVPLPSSGNKPPKSGERDPLQDALWEQHQIEVPILHRRGRRFVRVSCHLYNSPEDIDRLVDAFRELMATKL